ncbi:MAG: GNAT family N-acetyltransferase [Alistipes sp.]|nr:GNAT family N-acetyltransferase [Alistipes sp.]
MDIKHIECFDGCYLMQPEDIKSFADTLADGFSGYSLFRYACGNRYCPEKISLFWAMSIATIVDNAICIADSKEVNSVLIYIKPKSKEPGVVSYLKAGVVKMVYRLGLGSALKLLRFDLMAQSIAKRYRTDDDGYVLSFATRKDKQGSGYGKHIMEALLRYLDASGEGCYLETLKAGNVDLYKHFSFDLKEQVALKSGGLTLYAMHRAKR